MKLATKKEKGSVGPITIFEGYLRRSGAPVIFKLSEAPDPLKTKKAKKGVGQKN